MWDQFDDDWDEADEREFDQKSAEIYAHPLHQKASEIYELTLTLVETMSDTDRKSYGQFMLEDAHQLASKFAVAHAVDNYITKVENATLLKLHARKLLATTTLIGHHEVNPTDHVLLLREAIEDLRLLFVDWVQGFEQSKATTPPDGWGLFILGEKDED